MNISKATQQDAQRLATLINSAYRGETSKKGWTTEADLLEGKRTDANKLSQMMSREDAVFLKFCDEADGLKGCVYLEKKTNKMYLGMLTVSPTEQAKGIGKKLLSASEDYGRKCSCSAMQMRVFSVRTELINWYERHAYHKTGEIIPFTPDAEFETSTQPLEFIVLEKEL